MTISKNAGIKIFEICAKDQQTIRVLSRKKKHCQTKRNKTLFQKMTCNNMSNSNKVFTSFTETEYCTTFLFKDLWFKSYKYRLLI